MKTLSEIAYSIRDPLTAYTSSDDTRLDIELIYKKIADIRSALIREEFLTNKTLDAAFFQEYCFLEVQCKAIEFNGLASGDYEYYVEIPNIEASLGERAIKYFGLADLKSPFSKKNFMGHLFSGSDRYTSNVPYYTRIDVYGGNMKAILGNLPTDGLKYVCIVAVFEDPLSYCKPEDRFPIPQYLIHKLELIANKHFMSVLNIKPDERNDARDSSPIGNPNGNENTRQ